MAVKLLKVPPVTVTSLRPNVADGSLRVKLMVSLALAARLTPGLLRVTMMVGAVVSLAGTLAGTVLVTMLTVLLVSVPSVLTLPAASANLLDATCTTLVWVLWAVGVKVAV